MIYSEWINVLLLHIFSLHSKSFIQFIQKHLINYCTVNIYNAKSYFLNCSATKHDPITQKYHHYCFLDPWKFASCKSTHLGWNIIFKLQSKQYNNHLHYVWIMHYITYEHECQNSEKKKQGIFTRTKWSMNKIAKHWKHGNK